MNVKNVHRRSALILTFATLGEFNFINWFFFVAFHCVWMEFPVFFMPQERLTFALLPKKSELNSLLIRFPFFCCCCFFFPPPNEKECALSVPCSTKDNRSETVFCRSPTRTWIDHVWSGPFFFAWVLFTSLFSFHEDEEEEEEEVECRGKDVRGPRMRWKRKRGRKEKEREREREK